MLKFTTVTNNDDAFKVVVSADQYNSIELTIPDYFERILIWLESTYDNYLVEDYFDKKVRHYVPQYKVLYKFRLFNCRDAVIDMSIIDVLVLKQEVREVLVRPDYIQYWEDRTAKNQLQSK